MFVNGVRAYVPPISKLPDVVDPKSAEAGKDDASSWGIASGAGVMMRASGQTISGFTQRIENGDSC